MPANEHLTWAEIKDFAPGLYEADDWLMPPTAAQVMTDCYPQRGGGLRAFYAPTAMSVSGIFAIANERVLGVYSRGGIPARSGSPSESVDRYLVTYWFDAAQAPGAKARPRVYRMDGTNSEVTWTEINKTSGATLWNLATSDNNSPRKASFRFFKKISGAPNDDYVIAAIRYVGAQPGGAGIYRFNYNDLSSAQKGIEITPSIVVNGATIKPYGAIAVFQQRFLVTDQEVIFFSNVGDPVTFLAASFQFVDPSQSNPKINIMQPAPPSDLLLVREGAPAALLQGLITGPVTQLMSDTYAPVGEEDITRSQDGLYIIASDGHIYVTDGVTWQPISLQLKSFSQISDIVAVGDLDYTSDFLFAPKGYTFHVPTKSWFKQTALAGNFHHVEPFGRQIWGPADTAVPFALNKVTPTPGGGSRVSTYTWKSAPLRAADGRQLEIREVQVYVKSYDANATVAVTVGGTTVNRTCGTTGRQQLSFLFMKRAEVLDVQVVPASVSAGEAPSIETVRIGLGPKAHLLPST